MEEQTTPTPNEQDKEPVVYSPKRVRGSNSRAHDRTNAAKPSKRVRKAKAGAVRTMGSIDVALYKRLSTVLYRRWGINSKETSLLAGVALALQVHGKRTIAKDDVLRWLGFKVRTSIKKQVKWLETLSDAGFLLRVQFDEKGHGYGLTEYGQKFLHDLDSEYDKARQWVEDQHRFTDIVIYLDRVKEQLHPRQKALFTPAQIEQLKAIGKI